MANKSKSENVPAGIRPKFEEISQLTDPFCEKYLTPEYAVLCRQLTAALCRKRPAPLLKGRAAEWACGIVHALGTVNFLFDSSQTFHLNEKNIYDGFGVSQAAGLGKSKEVRDLMNFYQLNSDWSVPSKAGENPLIWMISVNGLIIDVREAPKALREEAFRQGLIPFIPEPEKTEE